MKKNLLEYSGLFCGMLLAPLTGLGSLLRGSRLFHSKGMVYRAHFHSLQLNLPQTLIVRFSQALWKKDRSKDVLGLTLRFQDRGKTQDLLFASFSHVLLTPLSPFISRYHFADNTFSSIAPFTLRDGRKVKFKLVPLFSAFSLARFNALARGLRKPGPHFQLMMRELSTLDWKVVGEIQVMEKMDIDQEALRFDPFLDDFDIRPWGYVQNLRIATYKLSQLARPKFDKRLISNKLEEIADRENVLPSSPLSHSPSALT